MTPSRRAFAYGVPGAVLRQQPSRSPLPRSPSAEGPARWTSSQPPAPRNAPSWTSRPSRTTGRSRTTTPGTSPSGSGPRLYCPACPTHRTSPREHSSTTAQSRTEAPSAPPETSPSPSPPARQAWPPPLTSPNPPTRRRQPTPPRQAKPQPNDSRQPQALGLGQFTNLTQTSSATTPLALTRSRRVPTPRASGPPGRYR